MRAYYCEPAARLLFFPQGPCSVASETGGGAGRGNEERERERKGEKGEKRGREEERKRGRRGRGGRGGRKIQVKRNCEGSYSGRSASSIAGGEVKFGWGVGEVPEANVNDARANSQN